MTNDNLTLIAVLVDRSWSMNSCREKMEGALNSFIDEQREQPGKADVALAQFDHDYEFVWRPQPIEQVATYNLMPRGNTALLDAVGRFTSEIGDTLANRAESKRPGKVIVVIVTDGQENASHEYSRHDVKRIIEHQQSRYQWEFLFLGANIDAVSEAATLGILRDHALTFNTANAGVTYATASGLVSGYRQTGNVTGFNDSDREAALK